MHNIHIAGTGTWLPEDKITNDEIVASFNTYADAFNIQHREDIDKGNVEEMTYSSVDFIEKASGIKTRCVIAVSYTHLRAHET